MILPKIPSLILKKRSTIIMSSIGMTIPAAIAKATADAVICRTSGLRRSMIPVVTPLMLLLLMSSNLSSETAPAIRAPPLSTWKMSSKNKLVKKKMCAPAAMYSRAC